MKPRFRAEWVVVREELLILASCLLRPMSRNSVLGEFRVRRFARVRSYDLMALYKSVYYTMCAYTCSLLYLRKQLEKLKATNMEKNISNVFFLVVAFSSPSRKTFYVFSSCSLRFFSSFSLIRQQGSGIQLRRFADVQHRHWSIGVAGVI